MAGNEAALSNAITPTADTTSGNRDAVANDKGQWFIRALALVRSGADWETIGACYGNNRFEAFFHHIAVTKPASSRLRNVVSSSDPIKALREAWPVIPSPCAPQTVIGRSCSLCTVGDQCSFTVDPANPSGDKKGGLYMEWKAEEAQVITERKVWFEGGRNPYDNRKVTPVLPLSAHPTTPNPTSSLPAYANTVMPSNPSEALDTQLDNPVSSALVLPSSVALAESDRKRKAYSTQLPRLYMERAALIPLLHQRENDILLSPYAVEELRADPDLPHYFVEVKPDDKETRQRLSSISNLDLAHVKLVNGIMVPAVARLMSPALSRIFRLSGVPQDQIALLTPYTYTSKRPCSRCAGLKKSCIFNHVAAPAAEDVSKRWYPFGPCRDCHCFGYECSIQVEGPPGLDLGPLRGPPMGSLHADFSSHPVAGFHVESVRVDTVLPKSDLRISQSVVNALIWRLSDLSRPTSCRAAWTWLAQHPSTLLGILAIDRIHSTSAAATEPAIDLPGLNDVFISASPQLPVLNLSNARQTLSSTADGYSLQLALALASPWPSFPQPPRSCYMFSRPLQRANQPIWRRDLANHRGPTDLLVAGLTIEDGARGAWVADPSAKPPTITTFGIPVAGLAAFYQPILVYRWTHLDWALTHRPYHANDEKAASGPRAVEFLRQLSSQNLFSPGDVADRINEKDPNELRAQHLALFDFECSRSARILHSLQDEKTLAIFKSIVAP